MQDQEYHVLAALEQRHWWYRSLRRRVVERLQREASRQGHALKVFDAGCGTGGMLAELQAQASIACTAGCDLHPLALTYARERGLQVAERSVNELPVGDALYDAVISWMCCITARSIHPGPWPAWRRCCARGACC